jgi:hypothetical protein
MNDKEKINSILNFTCDCGYNFENYRNDIFYFFASEIIWMKHNEFVICLECKKKYSIIRLKQYIRQLKVKKLCQNINI